MRFKKVIAITALFCVLFGTAGTAEKFSSNTFRLPTVKGSKTEAQELQTDENTPEEEAELPAPEAVEEGSAQVSLEDASSTLNVRKGPGTDYDIAAKVGAGDAVVTLGTEGEWTKVRLADGTVGYIRCDFLKESAAEETEPETEETPAETEETVEEGSAQVSLEDASSTLNVRKGPGTEYDIVAKAGAGDAVATLGTEGEWTKVRLADGTVGYIRSDFLAAAEEAPAAEEARDMKVWVTTSLDGVDAVEPGTQITLYAHLEGFEGLSYKLQWQSTSDGVNWQDEPGAVDMTYSFALNEDNDELVWRVMVSPA